MLTVSQSRNQSVGDMLLNGTLTDYATSWLRLLHHKLASIYSSTTATVHLLVLFVEERLCHLRTQLVDGFVPGDHCIGLGGWVLKQSVK